MTMILRSLLSVTLALTAAGLCAGSVLRAPAYPLITIDPYTNIWSMADTLYSDATRHWTGAEHPIKGVLTVDGVGYRFMGTDFVTAEMITPTSEWGEWEAKYTFSAPGADWFQPDYDDSSWSVGRGAFATENTNGKPVMVRNEFCKVGGNTSWTTDNIWIRRTVELPEDIKLKDVFVEYTHDDGAEIYINGIRVVDTGVNDGEHQREKLPIDVVANLHPGKNIMAVHCRNTGGYGAIDFGLSAQEKRVPRDTRTAHQTFVKFLPTQTIYGFECGDVNLQLTFTAPFLPENLELASRPINYISYDVTSSDGKAHDVKIRFEVSPVLSMDYPGHPTVEKIETVGNLTLLSSGTTTQNVLEKWGDDRRIDWGYVYLCADSRNTSFSIDDKRLSMTRSLGNVKKSSGYMMLGYDDIRSIQYLGADLRPYWNRTGHETIISQFKKASDEYAGLIRQCEKFDRQLMSDATVAGGKEYADLCALAWRQTFAAHKLVESPKGELLYLSKENFSNGSIGTVDLSYPSVPIFLLYNLDLAKALMNPIFDYCASEGWDKPFAAHDIGRYPRANGQNYGGDMPVEESGNMLIMAAAIAREEGNAEYALKHWPALTQWVKYLEEYGFDPENQLCTDDFAGHFAHNTNLSIKAILGIAAYGYLAGMAGDTATEKEYMDKARQMAAKWEVMANDGDHYRLTFDKPDTWSQKYNLVWDKLFGWNVFSPEIARKEIAYYLKNQNRYGLPLDNRAAYTKTDWIIWTATMADSIDDFKSLVQPVWLFMNETKDRVPMADWIWTDAPHSQPFRNRSVVGAYFIKLLDFKTSK